MIKIEINCRVDKTFIFPAEINTAYDYYSDFESIIQYLPHIQVFQKYQDHEYRLLYQTKELGVYQINIYCDLRVKIDQENKIIQLEPLYLNNSIPSKAGMNSITAQGVYASKTEFHYDGLQTRIAYGLEIRARLPVPYAIRMIPVSVLDNLAGSIASRRIHEIAEGFVNQSKESYQKTIPNFT